MKIGVVGLGYMGSTHLQAYEKIPEAEVVAVTSSDREKLKGDLSSISGNLGGSGQMMDFSSVSGYSRSEDLFADPNVEAVDLCVPTYLHCPLGMAALRAGKHVLVEKPMALTEAECSAMLETAQKQNRVLMVAQVLRFWPDYFEARLIAKSGQLGQIRAATFCRKTGQPTWGNWLSEIEKSGGGVFDLLVHDFDFCLHLLGPPSSVRAEGVSQPDNGIDLITAHLEYKNGPLVTVSGGWFPKEYPFSMEFTILGTEGALDFHSALRRLTLYPDQRALQLSEIDGFQGELAEFIAACEAGKPSKICPPEESAMAVELALAALESREGGGLSVGFRA